MEVADRIVRFYERKTTPPFIVYQYAPNDEYPVRNELVSLRRWLEAEPRNIDCDTVSLAEIFWEAVTENGQLEMLVEAEHEGAYEDAELAVRQILANEPTLVDRLVARVKAIPSEKSAVFLYRAGALYPAHRTSPLLDALRDKVDRPVTLLYPGRLSGDYGLSFMGKSEPTYGYRALIVSRSKS
jgi:hypothetical protein